MLMQRRLPRPRSAGRAGGTSSPKARNGAAWVTFHPAASKALIWRCRILASSGLWTTVMTRTDWVSEVGRARRVRPKDSEAITTAARGAPAELHRGIEEAPGDRRHRINVIIAMILQQDTDISLGQRLVEVVNTWDVVCGDCELLDQRIVEPQVSALLNQGFGERDCG